MKLRILFKLTVLFFYCSINFSYSQTVRYTNKGQYDIVMIGSQVMQPLWLNYATSSDFYLDIIRSATTAEQLSCAWNLSLNNELGGGRGIAEDDQGLLNVAPIAAMDAGATEAHTALGYADCDDDMSTFQSSSAYLDFLGQDACTTIEAAFLYWVGGLGDVVTYAPYPGTPTSRSHAGGATGEVVDETQCLFKAPGDVAYTPVTGINFGGGSSKYYCVADVTALMTTGGDYWVANVQSETNTSSAVSGWSLIVVFTPPNCPNRTVKIWDDSMNEGANITLNFDAGDVPVVGNSISYLGFIGIDTEDTFYNLYNDAGNNVAAALANAPLSNITFKSNTAPAVTIQPFTDGDQPAFTQYDRDGTWLTDDARDGLVSSQITSYVKGTNTNGNQITRMPDMKYTCGYDSHHMKLPAGAMGAGAASAILTLPDELYGGSNEIMAYMAIELEQPKLYINETVSSPTVLLNGILTYTMSIPNYGNAVSRVTADNYVTTTLDIPVDYEVGTIAYTDRNGNPISSSPGGRAPEITGQGTDAESLKFYVPAIAAADPMTGIPTDSVFISYDVRVVKPVGDPVWDDCRRIISNSSTIFYDTAEGLFLQSESNSGNGCGGVLDPVNSYVDDPLLNASGVTLVITDPALVCAPNTVDITAAAIVAGSDAGLVYSYFEDADTLISLASPAAIAVSGTYYIKGDELTGCDAVMPVVVSIDPQPSVTITDPLPVCAPLTVDLTDAAIVAGSTVGLTYTYWTDIAATIPLASPAAVTATGIYYIRGATGGGCASVQAVSVVVNPKPVLTVNATPAAICLPNTINLTLGTSSDVGGTITYYSNATLTTSVPDETAVATGGTYYVLVETLSGCRDTANITVVVNPKPVLTVNATPAAVCAPNTVNLTSGTSSDIGGTITYYSNAILTTSVADETAVSTSGTYYVLVETASGCRDTANITVVVHPKPVLTVNATPAAICAPSTVNLTSGTSSDVGGTITYYSDALLATSVADETAVPTSGTYYVLVETASGCRDTANITVVVNPKPVLTVITAPSAVCSPNTVDITSGTSSDIGGTITYYSDPILASSVAAPATIPTTGTYYVLVETALGCRDTASVAVAVNICTDITLTSATSGDLCLNENFDITLTITNAAAVVATSVDIQNLLPAQFTYVSDLPSVGSFDDVTGVWAIGDIAAGNVETLVITVTGTTAGATINNQSYVSDVNGLSYASYALAPVALQADIATTVNPKPVLTVNATPTAACLPSKVDLTVGTSSDVGGTITYYSDALLATSVVDETAIVTSGTYYVLVETASGCRDTASIAVVVNPKPVLTVTAAPAAVCEPNTIDITSGTSSDIGGTITYYSDALLTALVADETAIVTSGTYYVLVETTSGCRDTANITVVVNPKPVLTVNATPAAVCAPSTVNLTLGTSSDIGGAITYYSNAILTTSVADETAVTTSGTYYVLVETASGCRDTASIAVVVSPKPVLTVTAAPAAVCSPNTVDITSGTSSDIAGVISYYSDVVLSTLVGAPASVASTGTYYVLAETASGCRDTANIDVTVNICTVISLSSATSGDICFNENFDLTLTLSNAASVVATSVEVSNLLPAQFTYVSDVPSVGSFDDVTGVWTLGDVAAGDSENLVITVTGTTAGAAINNQSYISDVNGTTYASYAAAPVVMQAAIATTVNPKPVLTVNATPLAVCSPSTVDITVGTNSDIGGAITYYSDALLASPLTDETAVPTSGTYYVLVETSSGCRDTASIAVVVNPKPILIVNATPLAVCSPSTVDISVGTSSNIGGAISYYSDALLMSPLADETAVPTSGTYYVLVETALGCRDTASVAVIVNPKPVLTVNATPAAVCAPGIVDITVGTSSDIGGVIGYYSDAILATSVVDETAVLTSGTYYVLVEIASACRDTANIVVTVNPKPVLTVNATPTAVCSPSTVDISVGTSSDIAGTISYYSDALLISPLADETAVSTSGTYYVLVETASACRDTANIVVTVNPKPVLTVNATPTAVCSPSTVDISVGTSSDIAGTISYYSDALLMSPLADETAVSTSGTYYVLVETASACRDTANIVVTVNPKPVLTVNATPTAVCSPSTVDISVGTSSDIAGTISYYSDAVLATSVVDETSVPTSGTYYVLVETASGCRDTASIVVIVNPKPVLTVPSLGAVCPPSTLDLTLGTSSNVAGVISYYSDVALATPVADETSVALSGTYYVLVETAAGCRDTASVTVTVNPKPVLTVNAMPAAVCSPDVLDVTVGTSSDIGGTITYYSEAALLISVVDETAVAVSGTCYVLVETAAGCRDTASIVVTIDPKPELTVNASPVSVCSPSTVDITIGTSSDIGGVISYYSDALLATPLVDETTVAVSGTYYVLLETAAGCRDTASITVTVNPKPILTVNATPAGVCFPSTVDITVGTSSDIGGVISYYSDALLTASLTDETAVSFSGIYYVLVETATGCRDTASVTVTINPKPVLTVNATPIAVCSPRAIDITIGTSSNIVGAISYYSDVLLYSPVADETAINSSGSYYVLVETGLGCRDTTSIVVSISPKPILTVNATPAAVCYPSTVDLTVGASSNIAGTISYYSDPSLSVILANERAVASSGIYYVLVETALGCRDTASISVVVNPKPVLTVNAVRASECSPATVDLNVGTTSDIAGNISYFTNAALTFPVTNPASISNSGIYSVLVETALTCRDTASIDVTINPEVVITLASSVSTLSQNICIGVPIENIIYNLSGGATGVTVSGLPAGVSYDFVGGVLTIRGTPVVAGLANYTITTTGHMAPCVEVVIIDSIIVNELPVPVITGDVILCAETVGNVYKTDAVNNSNYTWVVSPGGTVTSVGGDEITVTWDLDGPQTVSVNYMNEFGCDATIPTVYNVAVQPIPDAPLMEDYATCKTTGTVNWTSTIKEASGGSLYWFHNQYGGNSFSPKNVDKSILSSETLYASIINSTGCESSRSPVTIAVNSIPIVSVDQEDIANIQIEATNGTSPYNYTVGNESGSFLGSYNVGMLSFGLNELEVVDANSCKSKLSFYIDPIPLVPDKFFSPNEDSNNNVWNIENIQFYPKTEIFIYDRYGKELQEYKGINFNGWDGTYNGSKMPTTDYWYVIQVRETGKRLVGHFLLKR